MLKKALLPAFLMINVLLNNNAIANNVVVSGLIPTHVLIKPSVNNAYALSVKNILKPITLEKITLSPQAAMHIALQMEKNISPSITLNSSNYIGMGNVPVLDQGEHGTCVTFAVSAAIDAAYNNSNYISQLCNLELGKYLQDQNSNYPSGWDGSYPYLVLNQMKTYGIITMNYQETYGCGNTSRLLKTYPKNDPDNTGVAMSISDFKNHSELVMETVNWKELLKDDDAYSSQANMVTVLQNVKKALDNGHRVTFATALDISDELESFNGAMGNFNGVNNDAWVVTKKIKADIKHDAEKPYEKPKINAGHAMVIIGYDDNAVIIDSDNQEHKGVLTLRNSWSSLAGDQGNYYMSYDYFIKLAMDAQEIIPQA